MEYLDLAPVYRVGGTVRLPGSKSISNRVLLMAALARGETQIFDLLHSDDTQVMLGALQLLGVQSEAVAQGVHHVRGCAGHFVVSSADIFLGNAGTAFRPLAAVLAVLGGEYKLSGVARMHERPIRDLVEALLKIGARIDYLGKPGYPPLAIHAGKVHAGQSVSVRGDVSSQFLTSLLLALPLIGAPSRILVAGELISKPYVEITLNLMSRFGVEVSRDGWSSFAIPAAHYVSPGKIHVEGDASSASYFLAAGAIGALSAEGSVRVEGVGRASIQGDVRFIEVLEAMGAKVSAGENWIEATAGASAKAAGRLKSIDADMNHIPDAAMTVAILALFADGPSTLRNIASWRVKETDRIAAMATEMRKLGAKVEEGRDYLRVTPPAAVVPNASIATYDDHRMAMCFSLAALGGVAVRIQDPGCVSKTFPEYFDAFASIVRG